MSPRRQDPYQGREPRRHEKRFLVTEEHIDALGHVNNVVYVRWIQDVAGEHWRTAADPELVADIAWVVTRHEIDYRRPAHLGDEVTARTWVGTSTPVRFERHVEMVDSDDRILVRSRSLWSPIDRGSGRIVKLGSHAHEPFYE